MVVAIIALLAALLLPALVAAREVSRRSVCLSNLRQWGVGNVSFAADHDDLMAFAAAGDSSYPGWIYNSGGFGRGTVFLTDGPDVGATAGKDVYDPATEYDEFQVHRFLGAYLNVKIGGCTPSATTISGPVFNGTVSGVPGWANPILWCPSSYWVTKRNYNGFDRTKPGQMNMNYTRCGQSYWNGTAYVWRKIGTLTSQNVLMMDPIWLAPDAGYYGMSHHRSPNGLSMGSNVLRGDFGAEWVPVTKMNNHGYPGNPSFYNAGWPMPPFIDSSLNN